MSLRVNAPAGGGGRVHGLSRTPPHLGHLCTALRPATTPRSARRWCSTAQQSSPPRSATAPRRSRSATPTARVTPIAPLTWQVRGSAGTPRWDEGGRGDWATQLAVGEGKKAGRQSQERRRGGCTNQVAGSQQKGSGTDPQGWGGGQGLPPGRCKLGVWGEQTAPTSRDAGTWALCHAGWTPVRI